MWLFEGHAVFSVAEHHSQPCARPKVEAPASSRVQRGPGANGDGPGADSENEAAQDRGPSIPRRFKGEGSETVYGMFWIVNVSMIAPF